MRSLTLADGQLPTGVTNPLLKGVNMPSAAVQYGGNGTGGRVGGTLSNTSGVTTETVLLLLSRAGGTNRRQVRVVLAPNEWCDFDGLAIDPADSLYGQTTHATTVDYVLFESAMTDFEVKVYDANGYEKVNMTAVALSTSSTSYVGYGAGAGGTVTQITNSGTAVTLNKPTGQITTVALTTAAGAEERFTVNDSTISASDVIALSTTYNGAGTPMLGVCNVTNGSFDIVITNLHASAAFNAAMVINFAKIAGASS